MKVLESVKSELDEKFQKIQETPAGFDFFVAIHDFVEHIESHSSLLKTLSKSLEPNQGLKIPSKYFYLKQIYQGLEDANSKSKIDIGHARCMVLVDLNQIRDNNFSESNSFWKNRDSIRKVTGEIYGLLNLVPA